MKKIILILLFAYLGFSHADGGEITTVKSVTGTAGSGFDPILQYGLIGVVIYFVIRELIGLVKWSIDRKGKNGNGSENKTTRIDIGTTQMLSDIYKKIDEGNREIFGRINSLYEQVQDIQLQQTGLPKTLFQEFVTQETCKERRELCPKRKLK